MDKIAELAQRLANAIEGSKVQVVPTQVINDSYSESFDIIISTRYYREVFCVCRDGDEWFWFKSY